MDSTALVVQKKDLAAVVPLAQMPALKELGTAIAKSGMFGKINEFGGEMLAMTMYQENISPVEFKRIHYVTEDGTIQMRADAMLAGFQAKGGKYEIVKSDDSECEIKFSFGGNTIDRKLTLDRFIENEIAVQHNEMKKPVMKDGKPVLKKNWRCFPADMLFARCCSSAIRKLMPSICAGAYTPEEIEDMDEDKSPKVISPDEVKVRAASYVHTAPAPVSAPAPASFPAPANKAVKNDSNHCPFEGEFFNKKWSELDRDIIEYAIEAGAPMTAEHIAAAKAELERRDANSRNSCNENVNMKETK